MCSKHTDLREGLKLWRGACMRAHITVVCQKNVSVRILAEYKTEELQVVGRPKHIKIDIKFICQISAVLCNCSHYS